MCFSIMKILLMICLYGMAHPIQTQFFPSFYSTPNFHNFQPVFSPFQYTQPQFYFQPIPQQSFYTFPSQINQPFTTPPSISQKSSNGQPSQTPKLSQPGPAIIQQQFPGLHQSQTPSALNDLLGFSYRTDFGDGATSAVVFFQGSSLGGENLAKSSITVASDSVDPQKTKDIELNIAKALTERTGKSLSNSPVLELSPVVSAILKNPSVQTGTFYYYQSDHLPADATLVKPAEDTTSTTFKSDVEETTTVKNDETTKEDIYTVNIDEDEEDVGQETEPSVKTEEEPAESILNENLLNNFKSDKEKESSTTDSTEGTTAKSDDVLINFGIVDSVSVTEKENSSVTTPENSSSTDSTTNSSVASNDSETTTDSSI